MGGLKAPRGIHMILILLAHLSIHWGFIYFAVPRLGRAEHLPTAERYEEVASKVPANFFNSNPIHCLRSAYVHRHTPPCVPYRLGKEHLQRRNTSIGLYFERWHSEPRG